MKLSNRIRRMSKRRQKIALGRELRRRARGLLSNDLLAQRCVGVLAGNVAGGEG